MTEFEMAYLFNDMRIELDAQAQLFFTVSTAFLVASYIAAHRLTRSMTAIVIGLYVLASAGTIVNMYRQAWAIAGLADEIRKLAVAGKGLAWHPAASMAEPALTFTGLPRAIIFSLATTAAVYFFFHCRRVNRKSETSGWKPKV
jgi:hypothetical protein